MKCKICFNIDKKNISYFYTHKNIRYYRCNNCFFIFQHPLPSNKELKKLYNKEYFNKNYFKNTAEFNLRKIQYKLDKKIILKHFKDQKLKKILDYGCGNGTFLKLFKAKKIGFEFNKEAKVDNSIKILPLKKVFNEKYDLIIMRGVIEHVPNFEEIIKKLSKCVNKNGLFYITATPNSNNLTFFLSNKDFNQNHPGHLFHFNNVNLSLLFLKNNFLNIDMRYEYLDTPYASISRDFINLKNQLKYYKNHKYKSKSPPSVGNMMTAIFKKMR
tara:strand:- start:157 stop:969 length:813 start_codon:yes stop_codon:yes gene_type:complete